MYNQVAPSYSNNLTAYPEPPTVQTVNSITNEIVQMAAELEASMQAAKAFLIGNTESSAGQQGKTPSPGDLLYRLSTIREILTNAIGSKNTVLQAIGL